MVKKTSSTDATPQEIPAPDAELDKEPQPETIDGKPVCPSCRAVIEPGDRGHFSLHQKADPAAEEPGAATPSGPRFVFNLDPFHHEEQSPGPQDDET